jgi:hypothetical protein
MNIDAIRNLGNFADHPVMSSDTAVDKKPAEVGKPR